MTPSTTAGTKLAPPSTPLSPTAVAAPPPPSPQLSGSYDTSRTLLYSLFRLWNEGPTGLVLGLYARRCRRTGRPLWRRCRRGEGRPPWSCCWRGEDRPPRAPPPVRRGAAFARSATREGRTASTRATAGEERAGLHARRCRAYAISALCAW
jgi:hypothetical protein